MAKVLSKVEVKFIEARRILIRKKLKKLNITTETLGELVGHSSKSYISDKISGKRPFVVEDYVKLSYILKIDLEDLIPPLISEEEKKHIHDTLKSYNPS